MCGYHAGKLLEEGSDLNKSSMKNTKKAREMNCFARVPFGMLEIKLSPGEVGGGVGNQN